MASAAAKTQSNDVLLVDDDADVLDSVADLISILSNRHVRTALGMAEVEQLDGGLPWCDLAIIDVNLGAGRPTGLDILRWLRSRQFRGRVVFVTGHAAQSPLVVEARATGVDILSKPIALEELSKVLESP